jgi:hypothetical protein
MEITGDGYIKKVYDETYDPNEDDTLTLTNVIIGQSSNITSLSPVELSGDFALRGSRFGSKSRIGVGRLTRLLMVAVKRRRNVRMNADEEEINIPYLNLGKVGNMYYDLPEHLDIDASAFHGVDPSAFEDEPWIEAENLTDCNEWRDKAMTAIYDSEELEWVCKRIGWSGNVTGLFLVSKRKVENPVPPEEHTEAKKTAASDGSKPDDNKSQSLTIGIAVGSAVVVITMIGVVAYCRLKNGGMNGRTDGTMKSSSQETVDVHIPATPQPSGVEVAAELSV